VAGKGILLAAVALLLAGCGRHPEAGGPAAAVAAATPPPTAKKGEHHAAHGGVLNAITHCEIGHAEAKLEGDSLRVWLVGGAPDTDRAVPVHDHALALKVIARGATPRSLVLEPRPLELADERVGDCSRFEGRAPWLAGLAKFTATGSVTFKGQKLPLRIEYPAGYDPD
jgi:hypothetical protein